jgi:Protein of unknown function (DUF3775)
VTDPDDGSNATDDSMISVLEDHGDDPVADEIRGFIRAMNEDEQIDLVALTWLGRGDGTIEDWDELRAEAARAHNKRRAAYLLGIPFLSDYLEEALSQFGRSCDGTRAADKHGACRSLGRMGHPCNVYRFTSASSEPRGNNGFLALAGTRAEAILVSAWGQSARQRWPWRSRQGYDNNA